jgi:hypothetical protein
VRTISSLGILGAVVLLAGCGDGSNIAPVSGQVMLNGKPLPNAYVMFQPIGTPENPEPGRGSMGITDSEGRFQLRYDGGPYGAVVGRHIVRITSVQEADNKELYERYKDVGTPDGEEAVVKGAKGIRKEIIPPEWNTDSKKEFNVIPGGVTDAIFNIEVPK